MMRHCLLPSVRRGVPIPKEVRWSKKRIDQWVKMLQSMQIGDSFESQVPRQQVYMLATKAGIKLTSRYISKSSKYGYWRTA